MTIFKLVEFTVSEFNYYIKKLTHVAVSVIDVRRADLPSYNFDVLQLFKFTTLQVLTPSTDN